MQLARDWEADGRSDARARRRPRSLRGQLILIPTAVLFLGLLGTVGLIFSHAQARIAAEISSGMRLGHDLITTALRNVSNASSPAVAFEQLAQDLPRVRHVRFEVVPVDGNLFGGSHLQIGEPPPRERSWLARLLAPPPVEQNLPIVVRDATIGQIRLHSNSADEITEILGEAALFSSALSGMCLLIIGALLWTVRRALRPVQSLADGFDRVEHGDYSRIAPIPIAEFRRVGQQFNHFVSSLHRVTADNHLLIDKLLSLQEQERKEVAAELHDEFGPAFFGIRTEAACIMKSVPRDTDAHARARSIAELTDSVQKLNYRMLDRLRPLVLDQMGLSEALRRLVASWRVRYPHITWSLEIQRDFDDPGEALSLTVYRIVQESMTNAIRHAGASAIRIRLGRRPANDESADVALSVTDNGRGLPGNFRHGFGLLGMTERVRQLDGTLSIENARPSGVVINVRIPERRLHGHEGVGICASS